MDSISILNNLIPTDHDAGTVFSGSPSGHGQGIRSGKPLHSGCGRELHRALHGIKGVSLGVTAFPGRSAPDAAYPGEQNDQTVAPVLRHNQAMHTLFKVKVAGGTPMDTALWWFFAPSVFSA
jgi:hypothetical protein